MSSWLRRKFHRSWAADSAPNHDRKSQKLWASNQQIPQGRRCFLTKFDEFLTQFRWFSKFPAENQWIPRGSQWAWNFRQKSMNVLSNFKNAQNVTPQRTHGIKYAAESPSRHLLQVARACVQCTGLPDEFACCVPSAVSLSPSTDWKCLVTWTTCMIASIKTEKCQSTVMVLEQKQSVRFKQEQISPSNCFYWGGCRPPAPLLILGGLQPPRPTGGGPAVPRSWYQEHWDNSSDLICSCTASLL